MLRRAARSISVVAVASLALGLAGCRVGNQRIEDSRTVEDTITAVRIEGGSGSVVLTRSDKVTQINRTVQYRDSETPGRADRVENGTLILNTRCAPRDCTVSYRVGVPGAVKVTGSVGSGKVEVRDVTEATLSTDSGTIIVANASGDVTVSSDSGSVEVTDIKGRFNAQTDSGTIKATRVGGVAIMQTDSGRIDATDLAGTQTSARTDSGSISLALTNAQDVTAQSDSGRIDVTVPAGSYRLRRTSDSGSLRGEIPTEPNGKYLIDLSTDSGTINVTQRTGA
jgi:hypothetical protein